MPAPWPFVTSRDGCHDCGGSLPVLHLPGTMPLWSWLYRRVAKSRYRFGRVEACDDGSCRIHR